VLIVALATLGLAQAARSPLPTTMPTLDVVSVKPFQFTGRPWHRDAKIDPQRLYIEGMAPIELINLAYSLRANQLAGLPAWAKFSHQSLYSVAVTTTQPATRQQMRLLLRQVLAKRFQLVLKESNELQPVFDLEVAPGGPKLQALQANKDCGPNGALTDEAYETMQVPESAYPVYDGCSVADLVARLNQPGWAGLPGNLPVLDKTGLAGRYLIALWRATGGTETLPDGGRRFLDIEPVQEAIKRELGLELVKSTATYRVLTVEHISRPLAN